MSCKRVINKTNGQDSILYKDLYDKLTTNEETLDGYYALIQSKRFKDIFGDWINDSKKDIEERDIKQSHVDDNGEPKLFYDSRVKKHYFLDKDNTKLFFPLDENGLENLYSENDVKEMAHIMAMNFISPRISSNFDEIDLDFKKESLKDSIISQLNKKIEEFEDSDNMELNFSASFLEESLDYIDEWVDRVKDDFKQYDITYVEEEIEEGLDEESTKNNQLFRQSSFTIDSKNNISAAIKLKLSILTGEELDPHFYQLRYIPLTEVINTLQVSLSDKIALQGEDLFNIYKNEIGKLKEKKPYLETLYTQLKTIDDLHKAEFVQSFNLDRNEFIGSTIIKNEDGYSITYNVQKLSNVGDKSRFVKTNWYINFVDIFGNEDRQMNKQSVEKFKKVREDFNTYNTSLKKLNTKENITEKELGESVNSFIKVLNKLGIFSSEEGFNHYLDNNKIESSSTKERLSKLIKLSNSVNFFFNKASKENLEIDGNVFNLQSSFTELAKANAFYIEDGSSASIFASGKTKWIYSYPSYLSTKIKSWKKNRNLLLTHYTSTPYNNSSYYMRWLLAMDKNLTEDGEIEGSERYKVSKERIDNFSLVVFNSLQEELKGGEAVDNTTMNEMDAIGDIFNKMLMFKANKTTYVSTASPAEKATQYQFDIDKDLMINTNARYSDGQIEVDSKFIKVVYNYVRGTYYRIKNVQEEIDEAGEDVSQLRQHYHLGNKNGLKFQIFPELSHNKFDIDKIGFELYDKDGKIRDLELVSIDNIEDIDDLPEESIEYKLIQYIQKEMHNKIKKTTEFLNEKGFITKTGEIYNNNFLDNSIWDNYKNEDLPLLKVAADIFANGLVSQVEYSKMFTGDVAYYKNMEDYKKRVPGTYTDGLQLYLKSGEDFFNASIISSIEIPVEDYEKFKENFGEKLAKLYLNTNAADAQAWITPERWKFLRKGLGKWKKGVDDTIWDKITGENKDPFTEKELKRVAQPLKGVYYEINNGVPVYLKYSQAVLVPNLIKGTELEVLFNKMTKDDNGKILEYKDQIHEVVTNDGIKVGAINPVTIHEENGSFKSSFKLNSMKLLNSGWKLQQDLPTKGVKDTDTGSQLQLNIYSGLSNNLTETFTIGDQEMSGEETISYLNEIIYHLGEKGLNSLKDELKVGPDYTIDNIEGFYNLILEALKKRGSNDNTIKAIESLTSPYGMPGMQEKIQNMFASLVRNRLSKIQTNGGSFVQTSSIGMNSKQSEDAGIIWTPWSNGKLTEPDIIKTEDGKDKVIPGGVMISGTFIAKYIPNYREILEEKDGMKNLFGTKEKNYTNGMIDSRILRNMIGYRIPNQALASNDALQIVGILPESVGDQLVPYIGTTTKTGSDFDIDKMFFMLPSFRANRKANEKLRKYAKDKLWGETIEETNANILNVIEDINESNEEFIDFDKNLFAKLLFSTSEIDLRNELLDNFIEIVLSSKSDLSKSIKEDIEDWNNVESLRYITSKDKDDNQIPLKDLSKEQLNNKLIETYKGILLNPKVIGEVMTPIDYPFMKDDINLLYPKEEKESFQDFDILNEIQLKYGFLAGQMGVGMTANMLKDHIRGTMAKLGLNGLGIGDINLDSEYSEELSDKDIELYLKKINKNKKADEKYTKGDIKNIKIAHSLSAILNAFVDIAKDAYITRGNWNSITSNVGMALIRAGVHPFKVNAILGQPLLKEYIEFSKVSDSKLLGNPKSLMNDFVESKRLEYLKNNNVDFEKVSVIDIFNKIGEDLEDYTRKNINKKLKVNLKANQIDEVRNIIQDTLNHFSLNEEITDISNKSLSSLSKTIGDKETNTQFQKDILSNFIIWQDISREVTNNIKASKQDTYAYGKNIMSLVSLNNLINKMKSNTDYLTGFDTKLEYKNEPSLLGSRTKNTVDEMLKIMHNNPQLFLSANPNIIRTFNGISNGIYEEVLTNDKLADKINKSYYTFIMSGFEPFKLSNNDKSNLLIELPLQLKKFQNELKKKGKSNIFIENIGTNIGTNGKPYIYMSNRKKDDKLESDIISAWKQLLKSDKEFADNLVKYSFITSGFQMNKDQFFSYIPYEWFIQNGINEYIDEVAFQYNGGEMDSEFIDQFFRHSIEDNAVVRPIYGGQIDVENGYNNNDAGFVLKEGIPIRAFYKKKPFKGDSQIFRFIGFTDNGQGVYIATGKLGFKDSKGARFHEYSRGTKVAGTNVTSNKKSKLLDKQGNDLRDVFKTYVDNNYYPDKPSKQIAKEEDITTVNVIDIEGNTHNVEYKDIIFYEGGNNYIVDENNKMIIIKNIGVKNISFEENIAQKWEDNGENPLNCN